MRHILILLTMMVSAMASFAQEADDIIGVWRNGTGKGQIQIYKHHGKYFGKIIWLKNATDANGCAKTDTKNEDEGQRARPLIGLVMLRDFTYDDGEWKDGRIYNPSDGKEYKAYIRMRDRNTLDVRGYLGFSLLGKTDTWTRAR